MKNLSIFLVILSFSLIVALGSPDNIELRFSAPEGIVLKRERQNSLYRFEWKSGSVLVARLEDEFGQQEEPKALLERSLQSILSTKKMHNGEPDYWKPSDLAKDPVELGPWNGWCVTRRWNGRQGEVEAEAIWFIRGKSRNWVATFSGTPTEYEQARAVLRSATFQEGEQGVGGNGGQAP